MDAGLLPVKRLSEANSRLSEAFTADERLAIARALLDDALSLCAAVDFLDWAIVTDDPEVMDSARARRLSVVEEPGGGLNVALQAGIIAVMLRGAESVTILPVDVPLVTPEDLQDVVDTGSTSDVVLAPARADGGTNALHLRPADALRPRFGRASLRAHAAEAEAAGLRCSILHLPRLALDVDTLQDGRDLVAEADTSGATALLLRDLLEARGP